MNIIYQVGIFFFKLAIQLAALFNEKAKLLRNGQNKTFSYLKQNLKQGDHVIWVHAASLGEFEQGRPLIEQIKQNHPEHKVLLTFFSPSGYEFRKNYTGADYICYLPADSKKNARKFIQMAQPQIAFFIKYEFWYNYFSTLKDNNTPIYLVSAIFRPNQLFFKHGLRSKWYQKTLHFVSHFFVQNQESANLLKQIGINCSTVTGDTRFDRVAEIAKNRKDLPLIDQFRNGQKLIVAGSTWEQDERLLINFINNHPAVKIIFAPHEIKESNLKRIESLLSGKSTRYSSANSNNLKEAQILIIDSIGLLSSIYRYADVAYIGGGFGVGIHNTLEAAIYNIPVIFGPNYQKFQEAVSLVEREVGFSISRQNELNSILTELLKNDEKREAISRKCIQFMNENIGATDIIFRKVYNN
ncbi:3-deoxy-D-manno-octulosonic acid transferase [Sunxiuqinia sp. A32]|uniref:3-deoxy-D-manno-octulosonic acid transferase n=1 Tax=Sunxiuqinia sp. A32 TaxID=3461496 RepID=UPI004045B73C